MTKATHKRKDLSLWFMKNKSLSWGIVTACRMLAGAAS